MDYSIIFEQLVREFDISSEVGRKQAYQKCIEYADENLSSNLDYNPFSAYAAKKLKQAPAFRPISKDLVKVFGNEKLYLTYSKDPGPILSGNKSGLLYLSQVARNLSESKMTGEHVHFYYGEFPLYGNSYSLTIYYEDDGWFSKNAEGKHENTEKSREEGYEKKNILPENIVGFLINVKIPLPPFLLMSAGKVYKAVSFNKYKGQKVAKKEIRENTDRMFIFKFKRDDQNFEELALDLDDDAVIFFTEKDLEQLKLI